MRVRVLGVVHFFFTVMQLVYNCRLFVIIVLSTYYGFLILVMQVMHPSLWSRRLDLFAGGGA